METVKRDTPKVVLTNWMVWPAAQFVNFYFVPLSYRILVASGVALFWNIYLSYVANDCVKETKADHTLHGN